MALTGALMYTTSEANRIDKTVTTMSGISFTVKENTSIMKPTLIITTSSSLDKCNYLYIQDWGRYYFVDEVRSVRNNVYELDCHVDVLYTYQDAIKQCSGVLDNSETTYGSYLADNVPIKNRPIVTTKKFPQSFKYSDMSMLLIVAGNYM